MLLLCISAENMKVAIQMPFQMAEIIAIHTDAFT